MSTQQDREALATRILFYVLARFFRPRCYDCGLRYDDAGFADLVVPNEVWARITPTGDEGGLLCPTCMVRAASKAEVECRADFRSGPFTVTDGPDVHDNDKGGDAAVPDRGTSVEPGALAGMDAGVPGDGADDERENVLAWLRTVEKVGPFGLHYINPDPGAAVDPDT